MLSVASVKSAGGAAGYFAQDNYYTDAEATEESLWAGEGAKALGLTGEEPTQAKDDEDVKGELNVEPEAEAERKADAEVEAEGTQGGEDGAVADKDTADKGEVVERPEGRQEVHTEGHSEAETIGADASEDIAARTATEPDTVATPGGHAADKMSPKGSVTKAAFEAILNGKLPDGTQVGDPARRQIGMDLTFSMPKSASVMAYVGGDKRILAAHMAAVKTTMSWAEKNLAEGREKIDGKDVPVRTCNLVYALFAHDTSRALDPQGHIHVVVANMTQMKDGTWKALHNGQLWKQNTVLGSIYHAAFRGNVEKLGYQVLNDGKHGTFEIKGVPQRIINEFSKRTAQINEKVRALGITTHAAMDKVGINTRDPKLVGDHSKLAQDWKTRSAALGFDGKAVLSESLARLSGPSGIAEKGWAAVTSAISQAREIITNLQRPSDPLVDKGLARLTQSPDIARTQLAVASAVRILAQREAAFGVHQLSKTALDLGLKGVTIDKVEARMTQLIVKGEVVPGATVRHDRTVTMLTTPEALQTETQILNEVAIGKGAVNPLIDAGSVIDRLQAVAGDHKLNHGQLGGGAVILASPDRIVAVQGIAGAGKSTVLAATARVVEQEGRKIIGLAFQNVTAGLLRQEAGIEAHTVTSFIIANERHVRAGKGPGFERARETYAGSVIVLDEASQVSNRDMLRLHFIANALGVDKFAAVGDRQQLLSINAGKSFALVQAGGTRTAFMTQNLRQRSEQLKTVARLANIGRAGEAIALLGAGVVESNDRSTDAAKSWLALDPETRARTLLLSSGLEARAAITTHIQQGLRSEGTLKGEGISLTVFDRVNTGPEELRYAQSYTPGQTVIVRSDRNQLALPKGSHDITRVFENGKVEVQVGRGRVKFNPQKLDPKVTDQKFELAQKKQVQIHEGDKIRWTANDKPRELLNGGIARILAVNGNAITIERADASVLTLPTGDPMLKRLDLAYATNIHQAQGLTTDHAIGVLGAGERFLSNQRLFNVLVTRVRDGLTIFTDDKERLIKQIDNNPGNKTSALETIGRLEVDPKRSAERSYNAKPFDPDALGLPASLDAPSAQLDLGAAPDLPSGARGGAGNGGGRDGSAPDLPPSKGDGKTAQLPVPDKSLGLEL